MGKCADLCCAGHADPEIRAFYYAQPGRAVLFISFNFLSVGILALANEQAGCVADADGSTADCDKRVYGARPSSMLGLMATLGSIITSLFLPYAGAIVDYTNHRLQFGRGCAVVLVLVNAVQAALFLETWFIFAILQAVIASGAFLGHSIAMWAYFNDVCRGDDEVVKTTVATARFHELLGMLSYIVLVVAVTLPLGVGDVATARIGQGVAAAVGAVALARSWTLFAPRPKRHSLPEGSSLWFAGFVQLWDTWLELGRSNPDLRTLLVSIMFLDGAIASFTVLAITYLTQQLGVPGGLSVAFVGGTLVFSLPGTVLCRAVARRVGHRRNLMLSSAYWIVITGAFIAIFSGPRYAQYVYGAMPFFGVGYGWVYPAMNGFFAALVPPGRGVELWGWNLLAAALLAWLPPLSFVVLNEVLGDMRLGFTMLIAFLAIGLAITGVIKIDVYQGPKADAAGKGASSESSHAGVNDASVNGPAVTPVAA